MLKRVHLSFLPFLLAALATAQTPAPTSEPATEPATAPATQPEDPVVAALRWPRVLLVGGNTITVYQPQIEEWTGDRLSVRSAYGVSADTDPKKQSFGIVSLTARADVDKESRLVTLSDIDVTKLTLPAQPSRVAELTAMFRSKLADVVRVVSLDHLEAEAANAEKIAETPKQPVQNPVPEIVVATQPTLLVMIDGAPALRPMEGVQGVMRVINSRALILLQQSPSHYYLSALNAWFTAATPNGPWTPVGVVPDGFDAIKTNLLKAGMVDALAPSQPANMPKQTPQILTATKPTELIQLDGDAQYTPIPDTKLLYVKNTDSALFMESVTSQYYVLISGRWFTSKSLQGPWTFVDGKSLPGDFAKIPSDSAKGNILVSVPGTPQANEAAIANSVPQTATVNVADAKLNVDYDGDPKFTPVTGVNDLMYATNTALPVIYVSSAKAYWCVQNGVWFTSSLPTGPWVVATSVPEVIYTIPVSSPIHYVTYVRVYGTAPGVVYVGYTPGYMGTVVSSDGVVVYGTGYYYPPYVSTTVWYGYPPTYGYGASFAYGAWTGFAFGFAAGAIIGDCWGSPYWGPTWGYGNIDINTASVYRNWRGGVTYANRSYSYDAWDGEVDRSGYGRSFNPYSGRRSVGAYETEYNAWNGDFSGKAAGATYNPRTGVVSGGSIKAEGELGDPGSGSVDRNSFRYNTRTNTGVGVKDDNVYAGRDGNVYRYNNDSNGWQKYDNGDWSDTTRDQNFNRTQSSNLNAQRQSRDTGQRRMETYQQSRSSSRAAPSRSTGRAGGGGRAARRR